MAGNRDKPLQHWLTRQGEAVYLALAGLLLLVASWGAAVKDDPAASSVLALVGGAALVAAPFASRLHGRLRIGAIEMQIRERVAIQAASAPVATLQGVLPLLESSEVAVRQVELPERLVDHALVDPELGFVRQQLQLSVIAARLPTERDWRAGGQLSELRFPRGTSLLVAGPPESIESLASTP